MNSQVQHIKEKGKMNKKNKIITTSVGILVAVGLLFGGYYLNHKSTSTAKSVTTASTKTTSASSTNTSEISMPSFTYKNIQSDGSFYVGKDGKIITDTSKIKNKIVIDWYLDPYCPACVKLETLLVSKKSELLKDDVLVRYHPSGFLNSESLDNYSTRASAYILGVLEYAPDLADKFLDSVVNSKFKPNGVAKSDKEFKELFKSIGGTDEQWKEITKAHKTLKTIVDENSKKLKNSSEMDKKSPSGKLFVPFVVIGDSKKALDFSTDDDSVQYLLNQVDKYRESLKK